MTNISKIFVDPIILYRCSRWFYLKRYGRTSTLINGIIRWWFGCFLPGSAAIGEGSKLGYGGIGIVIHKDAQLGRNVNVGPGVVIGGHGKKPGVPRIGNQVVIGAGAKILGGVVIGDGAYIGANAVVNTDIPPFTTAVGIPSRVLKK